MLDNNTKNLLQSKTVWGVIISFVGLVMNQMGFDTGALAGLEDVVVIAIGNLLALYGRIVAVKKIG